MVQPQVRSVCVYVLTCVNQLSLSLSEDSEDYERISIERFSFAPQQTENTFNIMIETDIDNTEPIEDFYITFIPTRNALFLPPRLEIRICGGKNNYTKNYLNLSTCMYLQWLSTKSTYLATVVTAPTQLLSALFWRILPMVGWR